MKTAKWLFALVVGALCVVLTGTPALAAPTIDSSTGVGASGSSVTFTDLFTISSGDKAVNLPAATFNYTIAPGTAVTASASTPAINAGIGSPTINNAVHVATGSGTTISSVDVTVDFSGITFTTTGIYRYRVTETKGASNVSADIAIDVNNQNLGTYVLDVYVANENGSIKPVSYVLSKHGSLTKTITAEGTTDITYTDKVDTITNEYTTYTLTVTKTIYGSLAAHDFPFHIDISDVPTDVIYHKGGSNVGGEGAVVETMYATLGNGGKVVISGLPSTAKYRVQETVSQHDGYTVTVGDDNYNAGTYGWIGTSGDATAFGCTTAHAIGKQNTTVAFVNNHNDISPTGIALRFGPYVLLLGFGLAFLLVRVHGRGDRSTSVR